MDVGSSGLARATGAIPRLHDFLANMTLPCVPHCEIHQSSNLVIDVVIDVVSDVVADVVSDDILASQSEDG